jgi:hypothetical protein
MDIEFESIKDLYERLKPALNTKEKELQRNNIKYIKQEDIWNYLKIEKWKNAKNLLLHEMVDDILNCDNTLLEDYVQGIIAKNEVKPKLDSEVDYEKEDE